MSKEENVPEVMVLSDEEFSVVKKLRQKAKTLYSLYQLQFTKMNTLGKTFNENCRFLVFFEDDQNEPEIIPGNKMGAFIKEHFGKQKKQFLHH
ncbi:MAG: hypothetical protein WCO58_00180 [bacterium]